MTAGSKAAPPSKTARLFLTLSIMAAAFMIGLDTTIVNVSLPKVQGTLSASQDEATWVLTSYIVAAAITTPACGWLVSRFGAKRVLVSSVMAFTVASILCGAAQNLGELVICRLLQGIGGAALIPVSQTILLNTTPPEKHGQAMALWGAGAMLGPIVGPVLGGWLTENFSWRWCFYINVPVGLLTAIGMQLLLHGEREEEPVRFDVFGFISLSLAIGIFQLMLDRGQKLDWFSSTEICIEAALSVFFLYSFIVHVLTTKDPFVDLAIFKDPNFAASAALSFLLGVAIFSVMALLPPILEHLMGYSTTLTGFALSPRGVGTFGAMMVAGVVMRHLDMRLLLFAGMVMMAYSMYQMANYSLTMGFSSVIAPGLLSGFGSGIAFVTLAVTAFVTLPPRYRAQATAMYTLLRNLGSSIGISVLTSMSYRTSEAVHAQMVEAVRPDNPVVAMRYQDLDFSSVTSLLHVEGLITRQATMVSFVNTYIIMAVVAACACPLVLLIKPPRRGAPRPIVHAE